jgi:hypothetical protein
LLPNEAKGDKIRATIFADFNMGFQREEMECLRGCRRVWFNADRNDRYHGCSRTQVIGWRSDGQRLGGD